MTRTGGGQKVSQTSEFGTLWVFHRHVTELEPVPIERHHEPHHGEEEQVQRTAAPPSALWLESDRAGGNPCAGKSALCLAESSMRDVREVENENLLPLASLNGDDPHWARVRSTSH